MFWKLLSVGALGREDRWRKAKKRKQMKHDFMLSTLFSSASISSCATRETKPKRLVRGGDQELFFFFLQSAVRQLYEKRLFGSCCFLCHGVREGEFFSLRYSVKQF